MTTVTELKKLFIELGGNPEDLKGCQTDADVIKLLSEVVGSTIELPAVSDTDNGKVLKVIEGAWGKGTDEALPEVTDDDNGKVLKVVEGAWAKGTDEALPEVTADDNGKVLKVVEGAWEKASGYEILKDTVTATTDANGVIALTDGSTRNRAVLGVIPTSDVGTSGVVIIPYGSTYTQPAYTNFKVLDPNSMTACANKSVTFDYYYIQR